MTGNLSSSVLSIRYPIIFLSKTSSDNLVGHWNETEEQTGFSITADLFMRKKIPGVYIPQRFFSTTGFEGNFDRMKHPTILSWDFEVWETISGKIEATRQVGWNNRF